MLVNILVICGSTFQLPLKCSFHIWVQVCSTSTIETQFSSFEKTRSQKTSSCGEWGIIGVGQGALVPFWGVLGALGLVLQWPIYFSSCSVVWVLSPSISVCSFAASTPRVYTILSVALWVHCLVAQFATCVPQHSMVFSDLVLVLCALLGACCCACIPFGVVLNIQLFLDVASWGIFWVGLWGPTSKDD